MNGKSSGMRNKIYSETEEEFLKLCLKLGAERQWTNADIARFVAPFLGRTSKGIEQKLGIIKQDLLIEESWRKKAYQEEVSELKRYVWQEEAQAQPKGKTSVDFGSSSIQSVEPEPVSPQQTLIKLDERDLGKRLKVRVYNVMPYGAFCETEDGKTGLIIRGHISSEFIENTEDYLQIGDVFEAVVVPDKKQPGKVLLNAKLLGDIVPLAKRR